jgi:hypothetical protein
MNATRALLTPRAAFVALSVALLAVCATPHPPRAASSAAAAEQQPVSEAAVPRDEGPPPDELDVVPPQALSALLESPEPAVWLVASIDGRPTCQEWRLDSIRSDEHLGHPDSDLGGRRPTVDARTARLVQQLPADTSRLAVQLRLSFPGRDDRASIRVEGAHVAAGSGEPTQYAVRIGMCEAEWSVEDADERSIRWRGGGIWYLQAEACADAVAAGAGRTDLGDCSPVLSQHANGLAPPRDGDRLAALARRGGSVYWRSAGACQRYAFHREREGWRTGTLRRTYRTADGASGHMLDCYTQYGYRLDGPVLMLEGPESVCAGAAGEQAFGLTGAVDVYVEETGGDHLNVGGARWYLEEVACRLSLDEPPQESLTPSVEPPAVVGAAPR